MIANRKNRTAFYLLPPALALMASIAFAQEMTERHIPVGAYPSLKSEYLTAGTITAVDRTAGTLTLQANGSERSFVLSERTKIWIDRSGFGQPTLDGDVADLSTGLKAEVRSVGPGGTDRAYWVKVQAGPP